MNLRALAVTASVAVTVLTAALAGCNRSAPANVAALVHARPITYSELDKQYQSQFPPTGGEASTSDDQESIQRLEVLRTLVDNEIMLQRAEKSGLMAADSEVEAKFTELK